MKIINGYRTAKTELNDPIVAIGIFDGIHIGHKRVISRVLRQPDTGRDKVVVTFDPHPQNLIYPKKPKQRIMSLEHRLHILRKMGIDAVIIIKFTEHIAGMGPGDFIKNVIAGIGSRTVYVGGNFHFGSGKSGDINSFKVLGKECGIEVHSVMPVRRRGKIVSSTRVRTLVSKGKLREAEELLRRPVSTLGTVVRGDEKGREIGFPTANIDPHHEVVPPPGVYAVKIDIQEKLFDGILNIGFKPTFYGSRLKRRKEPKIEAHVFGFTGSLYGELIEIFFIEKMRNERKFRSETALAGQISRDRDKAELLLASPRIVRKIKKYKFL